MNISDVGKMGVGETRLGEMGQIIGETEVGKMGTQFTQSFCNAKDSHILSTKNKSVFAYVADLYLTSRGLNDDIKLTKI